MMMPHQLDAKLFNSYKHWKRFVLFSLCIYDDDEDLQSVDMSMLQQHAHSHVHVFMWIKRKKKKRNKTPENERWMLESRLHKNRLILNNIDFFNASNPHRNENK